MVVGDIEYQFSWDDKFYNKNSKSMDKETRAKFFDVVKYCMWHISLKFNITFPKFKVISLHKIKKNLIFKKS